MARHPFYRNMTEQDYQRHRRRAAMVVARRMQMSAGNVSESGGGSHDWTGSFSLLTSGANAGSTSYDIVIPTTVIDDASAGDLYVMMIAAGRQSGSSGDTTVPTGWTEAVGSDNSDPDIIRGASIQYRIADAGDAAGSNSYTFTVTQQLSNQTIIWRLYRVAAPPAGTPSVPRTSLTYQTDGWTPPSTPDDLSPSGTPGDHLTVWLAHQQDNAAASGDYSADAGAFVADFQDSSSGADANAFFVIGQESDTKPSKTTGSTLWITWAGATIEW